MPGGGCLKNLLAGIGCLSLLVLAAAGGWRYRAQLIGLYRSVIGGSQWAAPQASAPPEEGRAPGPGVQSADRAGAASSAPRMAADSPRAGRPARRPGARSSVGRPSERALRSARLKQADLARRGGPPFVVLSADEVASLIEEGLGPAGRATLDSIEVVLGEGRLAFRARIKVDALGPQVLGPVAMVLNAREPIRASGPARVAAVGMVAWEPDSFTIREFPFPPSAVPLMVRQLTRRPDGMVPIPVPPTVGELQIRPTGVTFYRRAAR